MGRCRGQDAGWVEMRAISNPNAAVDTCQLPSLLHNLSANFLVKLFWEKSLERRAELGDDENDIPSLFCAGA